jgi:hypothetical protein
MQSLDNVYTPLDRLRLSEDLYAPLVGKRVGPGA